MYNQHSNSMGKNKFCILHRWRYIRCKINDYQKLKSLFNNFNNILFKVKIFIKNNFSNDIKSIHFYLNMILILLITQILQLTIFFQKCLVFATS